MTPHALTRRRFLGGAVALTAAGTDLCVLAAPASRRAEVVRALYERADGTATDTVWCRRAYLDLAGRIPTLEEAQTFAHDGSADKRTALVDRLLASEDFADYWSMRLADLLRVKSEFPINLWPNAVYVYHRRIRESLVRDESRLDFARALLTACGSNFRDPETNFLRATAKRTAEGLSEVASLTFLGEATTEFAPYFAGVRYKDTREWKEEIVWCETAEKTPADFAARLAGDLNDRFAAAEAQRVWQYLFCAPPETGRRTALASAFRACGFRLKPFVRQLVLSADYARGSVTGGFPVRRLDAEVLDDALHTLTGAPRDYQSIAPEPFTFLPPERKSVLIEDGSISNAFLILFGRPSRDSGLAAERHNEVTAKQRLYLFNSGKLFNQLGRLVGGKEFWQKGQDGMMTELYWKILSRPPSAAELATIRAHAARCPERERKRLPRDVAWCLLNTQEFLFRI